MRDLITRLSVTDNDAASALKVIAYFDTLVEGHASVAALIRAAAVLADCPAGFRDASRNRSTLVGPDGRIRSASALEPSSRAWADEPRGVLIWLERPSGPAGLDELIVERCAAAIRQSLDRSRHSEGKPDPRGLVEAAVDPDERRRVALELGLVDGARAIAALPVGLPGRPFPARLQSLIGPVTLAFEAVETPGWRMGIGPATDLDDLPHSWTMALTALRFTAEGDPDEPGPLLVHYDELGTLAVLALAQDAGVDLSVPDVQALAAAQARHRWALSTLDAVSRHPSLRQAAAELHLHHSSLTDRLSILEHTLGYRITSPQGQTRTALALALRRLERSGSVPSD